MLVSQDRELETWMNIAVLPLREPRRSLMKRSISSPGGRTRMIRERRRYKNIIGIVPRWAEAWCCEDDRKVIMTAAGSFMAIVVRLT
jgi:hypothetical protein